MTEYSYCGGWSMRSLKQLQCAVIGVKFVLIFLLAKCAFS